MARRPRDGGPAGRRPRWRSFRCAGRPGPSPAPENGLTAWEPNGSYPVTRITGSATSRTGSVGAGPVRAAGASVSATARSMVSWEIGSRARHVEHYSRRGMTYTTRSMKGTRFDHIAIGVERMADATDFLVGRLGGVPDSGGPGGGFRWAAWTFEGGGSIEVIERAGADGFLHRFLAARGPGLHHVTFKVSSLADAAARAEAQGYRLVGRDETDPDWLVAYLHPKEALGVVVQLGQSGGRYGRRPGGVPPGPAAPPAPARVLGLRTRARSADRARLPVGAGARRNPGSRDGRRAGVSAGRARRCGSSRRSRRTRDGGPLAIELGPGASLRAGLPPRAGPGPRHGLPRRPTPERGPRGLTVRAYDAAGAPGCRGWSNRRASGDCHEEAMADEDKVARTDQDGGIVLARAVPRPPGSTGRSAPSPGSTTTRRARRLPVRGLRDVRSSASDTKFDSGTGLAELLRALEQGGQSRPGRTTASSCAGPRSQCAGFERASGPRLRRRAAAHGPPLLHQLGRAAASSAIPGADKK